MIAGVPDDAAHYVLGYLTIVIETKGQATADDLARAIEHWNDLRCDCDED